MSSEVVCVTGASGYVASWLVKLLLERGYTVKASVRDLSDPKKTDHLVSLDGAKERLQLFKANLLEEGSFDTVVEGCVCVFHTASPFLNKFTNPQAELIEPAVKGTINVLESCARTPSVKRVVVTSSFAAVVFNSTPLFPDVVVDETWFSDPVLCEQFRLWYLLSKTLAEESAWKFAKEKGIDLITINPGMVIGPLLQPTINASAEEILVFLNGSETFSNKTTAWVHVNDVAEAHIRAFENPNAKGRYLVVESVLHNSEMAKLMKNLFPTYQIPKRCKVEESRFKPTFQVSQEKAKSLGIDFIPLEVSLKETVESLKEKNLFNP